MIFEKEYKYKNLIVVSFFLIYLLIGIFIHDDYGLSWDESFHRNNGITSLYYIYEFFSEFSISKYFNKELPSLSSYYARDYGVFFDVFLEYLDSKIQFSSEKEFFIFKHLLTFIVFFIATIFFYDLASSKFKDWRMGLLACLILILSPRMFAESFYNMKDLIFMSFYIIAMNTGSKYLVNQNFKNIFLFSLTAALMIDIRSIGILLPILVIFLTVLQYFNNSISLKNLFLKNALLIFLMFLFIVLFWPRLWEAPISNFISSIIYLKKHYITAENLYLGQYVRAQEVPWHYLPVWIGVTTPIAYLILFFLGIFFIIRRFINRLDKINDNKSFNYIWRGNKELLNLFYLGLFLGPLILIIKSNATLYDGWRHAYFLYPPLLLISLNGFYQLWMILKKSNIKIIFISIFVLSILPSSYWMIKAHPFQYVYFNFLAGKTPGKYFELDYWGVSNREILERLIKKRPNEISKIWVSCDTPLKKTLRTMINEEDRSKIKVVKNIGESDYILHHCRYLHGEYSITEYNFDKTEYKVFEKVKAGNIVINALYKNTKSN